MATSAGEGQNLTFLCQDMRLEVWFLRILDARCMKLTVWTFLE